MKFLGSIMVILICSILGMQKGREYEQHLKALEAIQKIFTVLKSELIYTKAPMTELLAKVADKTGGSYRMWLIDVTERLERLSRTTFREVWKESIYEDLKDCKLAEEDLEELCKVGEGIGYPETIELYLSGLKYRIDNTREELKSKKKLYQTMGILCGVFLVIVLL